VAAQDPQPRHHAPGGWRRALMGVLVGASFGAWVTRVVPADRTWPPSLDWLRGPGPDGPP
jgi:hypothetical protein